MDEVANHLRRANESGLCPMCNRRPRAYWGDTGAMRVTCGDVKCFLRWVPGGREAMKLMELEGGIVEDE